MKNPARPDPPLGPPPPSPREQTLAAWRRIDLRDAEKARTLGARPAADLLPKVLAKLRFEQRRAETEIVKVWNHALDPSITVHAQPTGLRSGTLFVTVDSNTWLSEIVRYRRQEILERLQHSFGKTLITRISFRTG